MRLAPNTRERINPGSADSFGCACGADEIHARLEAKTADVFDGEGDAATAQARAVCDVMLDDLEVRSRWWSAGPENKDGVAQRLTAFLHQVQYAPVEASSSSVTRTGFVSCSKPISTHAWQTPHSPRSSQSRSCPTAASPSSNSTLTARTAADRGGASAGWHSLVP